MSEDIELRLKALLAAPHRAPDETFAARVGLAVVADARMRAARRAAWTRAAAEAAAAASAIVAFVLLARLAPAGDSAGLVQPFGPAGAGLVLLALWILVGAKPAEAESRL
jgi:hypothetical protein